MQTTPARRLACACCALVAGALAACTSSIQGRVVRGDVSYIEVVDSSDPRLSQGGPGVGGVAIHAQLDPTAIKRKTIGRAVSGGDGRFSIPLDEFGAGLLDYDLGVYARRRGFEPAEGFFKLPGGSRRVLVVMAPGQDKATSDQPDTLWEEFDAGRLPGARPQ